MGSIPKCLKGAHTVRDVGMGFVYVAGARNDRHLFVVAAKCYEQLNYVTLMNKTSCFWPP
jgi:hypothetical protein